MHMLTTIYFTLLTFFFGLTSACSPKADTLAEGLQKIGQMTSPVEESSGIENTDEPDVYLTHNDAGGKAALYKINGQGKVLAIIPIPGAKNSDWEDLTRDTKGYLYIGDFGNNENHRRDLRIYKVRMDNFSQVEEIRFRYDDQEKFPPAKGKQNFDSESFFWHEGKLYLITKDRGDKSTANMYEVTDQPGEHVARKVDAWQTGSKITSADITPDGKRLALLSNKKLHLFNVSSSGKPSFFEGKHASISLKETGQAEGVVFLDSDTVLITDEEGGLYRYVIGKDEL
jgi:uncharacterized protein YjiK